MNFNELFFFEPPVQRENSKTIDEQILRALTHPNVLLHAIDAQTKDKIAQTIKQLHSTNKDLVINIIFGAYKSEDIPSPKSVNWAEVFHLRYMLQILSQIALLYPRKVVLEYILQDTFLERFNAISKHETDIYIKSFFELVDFYNQWLLKNNLDIYIDAKKESDILNMTLFNQHLMINQDHINSEWQNGNHYEIKTKALERAERNNRNFYLSPQELYDSALFHTAYIKTCIDLDIRQSSNKILLVHRKIRPGGETTIPFRSCSSSAVQFWIGEGVLIHSTKKIYPTILSPLRLQEYFVCQTIENKEINFNNDNLKRISTYALKETEK